jgi:hypothetical protein
LLALLDTALQPVETYEEVGDLAKKEMQEKGKMQGLLLETEDPAL